MKQSIIPKKICDLAPGDVRRWGSLAFSEEIKLVMFISSHPATGDAWPGVTVTYFHQDGFTFNITYGEDAFIHEDAHCLVLK